MIFYGPTTNVDAEMGPELFIFPKALKMLWLAESLMLILLVPWLL